jgi:hypothetical protein
MTSNAHPSANDVLARIDELMAEGMTYPEAKAVVRDSPAPVSVQVYADELADEATTISTGANGHQLRKKHRRTSANGLDPLAEVTEEAYMAIYEEELELWMSELVLLGRVNANISMADFRSTLVLAIAFIRVSIDNYNVSKSPLRQARAHARAMARWGRNPIEVHVERAVSGMAPYDDKEQRVIFEALWARFESGEFGTKNGAKANVELWIESFSRWTRSVAISGMCGEKMKLHGFFVQLSDRMIEGPYTSVEDNANALIAAGVANDLAWRSIKRVADEHQFFLLSTGELMADYSQTYGRQNEVSHEYTTKGIKKVTSRLCIVPGQEEAVGREMLAMTLAGIGQRAIEREFEKRDIRTRPQFDMITKTLNDGNRWTNSSITKWLRKSTLCGLQYDPKGGKEGRDNRDNYYPCDKIEKFCTVDEWWTIQGILDGKRDANPGHGTAHKKHRGSLVLGCELCWADMYAIGSCYGCSWRNRGYNLDQPGVELPFPDQAHATMKFAPTDRMLDEVTIAVVEALPADAFESARVVSPTADLDGLHGQLAQIAEERRLTSVKLNAKLISEAEAVQLGVSLEARALALRDQITVVSTEPLRPLAKILKKIGNPASFRDWYYDPSTDEEDQGAVIAAVWSKVWVAAGVKHTHTMDIERRMRFVAVADIDVPPVLIEAVRERVIAERLVVEGSAGMSTRGRVEIPVELSETILGWNYRDGLSGAAIGKLMNADPASYPPLSEAGWYPNLIRRFLDAAYLRHPELERPSKTRLVTKEIAEMIDNLVPKIGYKMTAIALNAANKKRPKTDEPWDYFSVYTVYHGGKTGSGAPRKMTDELVTLAYALSKLNRSLQEISDYIFEQTGVRLSRGIISRRLAERKEAEARKLLADASVKPPKQRRLKPAA